MTDDRVPRLRAEMQGLEGLDPESCPVCGHKPGGRLSDPASVPYAFFVGLLAGIMLAGLAMMVGLALAIA